ncbi:atrial natriuretic peptide receptor 1-like isoform X2 [Ptychodera flava]|uniref:atrial natriuretic peptide receptor 1-like isoform X2 n=1 Tax=Ptychodera flava TaxID=63121 RepID=UPI00396A7ABF
MSVRMNFPTTYLLSYLFFSQQVLISASPPHITVGLLLPINGTLPFDARRAQPGIDIAFEEVQRRVDSGEYVNFTMSYIWKNTGTECTPSKDFGPASAADLYYNYNVDAFIGPGCSWATEPTARLAKVWNLAVVSGVATEQALIQKDIYTTLTRVSYNSDSLSNFYVKVFERFGWTKASVIVADNVIWKIMGNSVLNGFRALDGYDVYGVDVDESADPNYEEILMEATREARIVIIAASGGAVRQILIKAYDHGMINGEFAFFNIYLVSYKYYGENTWFRGDEYDDVARMAYEALNTMTLYVPSTEEYEQFAVDVKRRAIDDYNYDFEDSDFNYYIGSFHDTVLLFSLAVNETLSDGADVRDGVAFTHRMWNRTFTGILGDINMDDNGDRHSDFSMLDMNENFEFEVVANYFGARGGYDPVPGKAVRWPAGATGPPRDEPYCGFYGEKPECNKEFPLSGIIGLAFGGVIVAVMAVVAFVMYRRYKLEQELANMMWKVKWDDVIMSKEKGNSTSRISLMQSQSNVSSYTGQGGQIFTTVATYKGNIVAVKQLNKKKVELTREVLLELKHMRDIHHSNITSFIGACIDYPHICTLTEYCPKGSLQDILQNEAIKLDWVFKYSLMQDIVTGLYYLHGSIIRYHGNLKSSNCVVDSRFVLKLTDFGLEKFKEEDREPEKTHAYYAKMLWTAPEILRQVGCRKGSQKGDLYSYGVILQEIILRTEPFEDINCDQATPPQEIIEKVRSGCDPPYRPIVPRETCPDEVYSLMTRCWAENPESRTDISSVKSATIKLNKDRHSGNLVDNLLQRMEQYATNLESLVEERTQAFLEEKRKSEELLYQVLPRSIAEQLKRGNSVEPEAFESVTIYFSDVVGFTSLSAASTPMQVVDLLNDLYTCFDAIIDHYDVYKVETIGDAYMVVSGLPIRNGNNHAREIARMSLALLTSVTHFKVRHRPDYKLRLRIGLHTGSCVSGVVGLKMPRYCLFGDTVNTASRMESNGEALRIHMSSSTKDVLDTFGTFQTELRGQVEMKIY